MKRSSVRRRLIYGVTTLLWCALVLIHLTSALLEWSGTPPADEVYANDIGFQIIAFVLTTLPYWLLGLLAVLLIEFMIVGRKR